MTRRERVLIARDCAIGFFGFLGIAALAISVWTALGVGFLWIWRHV